MEEISNLVSIDRPINEMRFSVGEAIALTLTPDGGTGKRDPTANEVTIVFSALSLIPNIHTKHQ